MWQAEQLYHCRTETGTDSVQFLATQSGARVENGNALLSCGVRLKDKSGLRLASCDRGKQILKNLCKQLGTDRGGQQTAIVDNGKYIFLRQFTGSGKFGFCYKRYLKGLEKRLYLS